MRAAGPAGRRMSLSRASSSSRDPYRDDSIPAELYDTSRSRFSDASLFERGADGSARTTFPWRTTLVAVLLFGVGLMFLLLGVLHFRDKDRGTSIAFICLGCLTFLPGGYVVFNLVQVLRGAPGFHLSDCGEEGNGGGRKKKPSLETIQEDADRRTSGVSQTD